MKKDAHYYAVLAFAWAFKKWIEAFNENMRK